MPGETQKAAMVDTIDNQTQDEWNEEIVYDPSAMITTLDQIEDLVESSRTVPLPASTIVNKAEILGLLDQAREALSEDLAAVDAVVADAGAVLGCADSAAETRIIEANSRASSIPDQTDERTAQILADAEEETERTRSRVSDKATTLAPQACSNAEATIADANVQAARIISIENIMRVAEDRAHEIVPKTKRSAVSLCEGADDYVASSLDGLAHFISGLTRRTDAGRRTIAKCRGVGVADVDLTNE